MLSRINCNLRSVASVSVVRIDDEYVDDYNNKTRKVVVCDSEGEQRNITFKSSYLELCKELEVKKVFEIL